MSDTQDIIGIVNELEDMQSDLRQRYPEPTDEAFQAHRPFIIKLLDHFPAIAQALLDREEKLRIAEEALEKLTTNIHTEGMMFPDGRIENKAIWTANQALTQIRS